MFKSDVKPKQTNKQDVNLLSKVLYYFDISYQMMNVPGILLISELIDFARYQDMLKFVIVQSDQILDLY